MKVAPTPTKLLYFMFFFFWMLKTASHFGLQNSGKKTDLTKYNPSNNPTIFSMHGFAESFPRYNLLDTRWTLFTTDYWIKLATRTFSHSAGNFLR